MTIVNKTDIILERKSPVCARSKMNHIKNPTKTKNKGVLTSKTHDNFYKHQS